MRIPKRTVTVSLNLDKVKRETMDEILEETADLLDGVVPCLEKWESELDGIGPIIHQDTYLNNTQLPPLKQEPRSVVFVGTVGVEYGGDQYDDDGDFANAFGQLTYNGGFVDDTFPIPQDYNFKPQYPNTQQELQYPWVEHNFDLGNHPSPPLQNLPQFPNNIFNDPFLDDNFTPFIPPSATENPLNLQPTYVQTSFQNSYHDKNESEALQKPYAQPDTSNDPTLAFSMDESRLESLLFEPQSEHSTYSPSTTLTLTSIGSTSFPEQQPFSTSSFASDSVANYSAISSPDMAYSSPSQHEILEEIYRECAEIERNSSASPPEQEQQQETELKRKYQRPRKVKEQSNKSPENPIAKRKTTAKSANSKKASGSNHKKELNRVAATKYREKKRREREETVDVMQTLIIRNSELKDELKSVETEIGYLKNLILEIKARANKL